MQRYVPSDFAAASMYSSSDLDHQSYAATPKNQTRFPLHLYRERESRTHTQQQQ